MKTCNKFLTVASERILKAMQDEKYNSYGELTFEKGAGWWVGYKRVGSAACQHLLMYCLIHLEQDSTGDEFERYMLNTDGKGVLNDPEYVPVICRPR